MREKCFLLDSSDAHHLIVTGSNADILPVSDIKIAGKKCADQRVGHQKIEEKRIVFSLSGKSYSSSILATKRKTMNNLGNLTGVR